ncbi:adenosine deaminase [Arsenicicoccus sp. oral taxon 190]|uniref:adenosine deaminase n=1 Tax=Arsenicicoccus sp. oral taxon 190 TaxID=1658671 RepID=UPI000A7161D6|nr:adenosine deaminase [Arsenicicoccus sp. oral taxon 190]
MTSQDSSPSAYDIDPVVAQAPKVLLHEHLDGGLRPATVLELAHETGYAGLPADDAAGLARWFRESADSGSLVRYLETFEHTVGVMQTPEALRRVACEEVLDLARDGVVYAEIRYAPELHLERDLTLEEVVEAVNEGFREGEALAREEGRQIRVTALLTAMRHAAMSREIAELAVAFRDQEVSGFDIAGAEAGYPPTRHLDAFQYLARENAHFTIHAGEAFGLPSIQEALTWCGADRLGHGVRIVDDITVDGTPVPEWMAMHDRLPAVDQVQLGLLAAYVRDKRVPLEMCPSSNVQTGASASIALHPITLLKDLRFRVTINTDNRLMSDTSMGKEMTLLVRDAGWTVSDLRWATINAMKSSFLHFDERLALIDEVIKPAYAQLV